MVSRQTIVYTAGVWDLLHVGHVRYLERAKAFGDVLVVGVQADELVTKDKGSAPIISMQQRIEMLRALACVDKVVPIEDFDYVEKLKVIKPHVYVWTPTNTKLRHFRVRRYAEEMGIKVIILPYCKEISSTEIRSRCERG